MGFLSSGISPSLIHGVDIKIQRLDKQVTQYDDDFREPSGKPQYKEAEEVIAQIHYKKATHMNMAQGGDVVDSEGWLTFLREDLESLPEGYFKQSDKIIEVDGRSVEYYIQDIDPLGHYRTSTLCRFFFKSRDAGFGTGA